MSTDIVTTQRITLLDARTTRLESGVDRSDEKFEGFLESMYEFRVSIDQRFDRLESRIERMYHELSTKIDKVSLELSDRINSVNLDLSAKIDKVNSDLSESFDEANNNIMDLTIITRNTSEILENKIYTLALAKN